MIIRNPLHANAPIRGFNTGSGKYTLEPGDVADFGDADAKALLDVYGFLECLDHDGNIVNRESTHTPRPSISVVDGIVEIDGVVYKRVEPVVEPEKAIAEEVDEPKPVNKSVTDEVLDTANFENEEEKPSKKKDQSSKHQKQSPKTK